MFMCLDDAGSKMTRLVKKYTSTNVHR